MNKSQFEITSWEENPYFEGDDGIKLTRAVIIKSYSGDITGNGNLEYIMAYKPDGSASFVGIEYFEGSIGPKSGTCVLEHEGTFQEGTSSSSFRIIEGSATGELSGLTGEGGFSTGHGRTVSLEFNYKL